MVLGDFKKHESLCIRVKYSTELFLRILRIRDPKITLGARGFSCAVSGFGEV